MFCIAYTPYTASSNRTIEYWVYRPPIEHAAKTHIRNVLFMLSDYNLAYFGEVIVKTKVLHITRFLKNVTEASKAPPTELEKSLSKEEMRRRGQEEAQKRMTIVNELTALVPLYNNAVLSYIRALQCISIEIEAAIACIKEFGVFSEALNKSSPAVSVETTFPGKISVLDTSLPSFMKVPGSSSLTSSTLSPDENLDDGGSLGTGDGDNGDGEDASLGGGSIDSTEVNEGDDAYFAKGKKNSNKKSTDTSLREAGASTEEEKIAEGEGEGEDENEDEGEGEEEEEEEEEEGEVDPAELERRAAEAERRAAEAAAAAAEAARLAAEVAVLEKMIDMMAEGVVDMVLEEQLLDNEVQEALDASKMIPHYDLEHLKLFLNGQVRD